MLVIVGVIGVSGELHAQQDALPSWRDGTAKHTILEFVQAVSTKGSPDWVAPADRIATFDQDGTLLCEQPYPVHVNLVLQRYEELIQRTPSLVSKAPYKEVHEQGPVWFNDLRRTKQSQLLVWATFGVPFSGLTVKQYQVLVRDFVATWRHATLNRHLAELAYVPMLELIRFLQANEFRVFVVTADEAAFVQVFSQSVYAIPTSQVIGSSVRLEFDASTTPAALHGWTVIRMLEDWGAVFPPLPEQQPE